MHLWGDLVRRHDLESETVGVENLPDRFMYSVDKARARSVKGSRVECVRVAKAIVNMLLQAGRHGIC
jgi:hypothetical protein